jgi:hypothetical protein
LMDVAAGRAGWARHQAKVKDGRSSAYWGKDDAP